METFVNVIEAGSFSGAARRLNVGQPAVSKTVAQLEERLGVSLLLRSTRGLTPTEAGQNFYERARRSIEEADEADRAAQGAGAGLSGPLRVCAAVTFARLRIVPYLQPFLAEHPDITLDIMLDDRNVDMLEEGIDVALRMGTLGDSGMTAKKIAQCRRVVVGTPAYFEREGEPEIPADLGSHQAIIYGRAGGGHTWAFRHGSTEVSVAVSGRIRVNAAEGVRAAVLAGMGLAIASEWMFGPELEDGRVKRVLADWALPPMDLWAMYPTGRLASAKARAFVAFVEKILAA
jgi:DNA-binding transcriptional LysR family regulator